jgi:hypothetical protein
VVDLELHVSHRETSISQASVSWLFLLFNLPAKRSSERVKVWRRLKKFGAVQLKTSTYVLPDEPVHYERFQWLATEIDDTGVEQIFKGWAKRGLTDQPILTKGGECFDALHAQFKKP